MRRAETEFARAVRTAEAPIPAALRDGLAALGNHSNRIHCKDTRRLTGSIDVDGALYATEPTSSRWDYGLGWKSKDGHERAIWVEVHPATAKDVDVVLRKLEWLRAELERSLATLSNLTNRGESPAPFHWLSSGGCSIQKGSPHARRLSQSGLGFPKKVLVLP